ncbi:MAG: TolC family outer membrane protein [Xanthomonadaceae bacterium]|nr:TolC family outer membrane protein [Xanthomonadaceae bacterium]
MWRYGKIIIFLLLFPSLVSWVQPAYGLNLLAAYRQAAASDPLLARARANLELAKTYKPLAKSSLLPELRAGAGVNRKHSRITGAGPETIDESIWGNEYSITLKQPVFDGQAYVSLRAAESRLKAGEAALMWADQDLIHRVCRLYFGVLQAQADAKRAASNQALFQKIYLKTKAAMEVGTGNRVDLQESLARRDAAAAELVKARNQVLVAKKKLAVLIHQPVEVIADVVPLTPRGPEPDRMDLWVKSALDNQPVLDQARQQLQVSRDEVEIARRERWPRLDFIADAGYLKGGFLPEVKDHQESAGFYISFPLYLGGSISARTSQARAAAKAGEQTLASIADQVKVATQSAFLFLRDSVAILEAAERSMKSAGLALAATKKGYEVGERNIIDLMDTAEDYHEAQKRYFVSLYNHLLARIELKTAAGVVSVNDIESINSLLK